MSLPDPRPGLSKIRKVPIFRERRTCVVRANAGRVRELVEAADIVSEGATRLEGGSTVYYGTTSLLLRAEQSGLDVNTVARLLASDPHVRVLALRVARREISARVVHEIGTLRAEISVGVRGLSVAVDVDLVATIAPSAREAEK